MIPRRVLKYTFDPTSGYVTQLMPKNCIFLHAQQQHPGDEHICLWLEERVGAPKEEMTFLFQPTGHGTIQDDRLVHLETIVMDDGHVWHMYVKAGER